ncbi:MAG: hypothetical protein E6H41_02935, partial [Betaproteobacteria bacterium]
MGGVLDADAHAAAGHAGLSQGSSRRPGPRRYLCLPALGQTLARGGQHPAAQLRGEAVNATRRKLVFGTSAFTIVGCTGQSTSAPHWKARQFHNQPAQSHQHQFLSDLWAQVAKETGGRLQVTTYPQNNNLPGSDPGALELLQSGELEFFTLMGGILGRKVPVAEIQGMPFAFTSHAQVHRANDGALGEYLGRECAAKGIYRFQYGLLENGFRQISTVDKPVFIAEDLRGMRMRVPDGQMFRDVFTALESQPVTINIRELYAALKSRQVDGQENPLVITEVNRL